MYRNRLAVAVLEVLGVEILQGGLALPRSSRSSSKIPSATIPPRL